MRDAAPDDLVGHRAHLVGGELEVYRSVDHGWAVSSGTAAHAATSSASFARPGRTCRILPCVRESALAAEVGPAAQAATRATRSSPISLAGVTVGLVALPLAMAFAISSGVPPQAGLYCAIVAGFLISALGGSRSQIGGPTGAFVVVVAGIVATYGLDGLFMCTMMAGVMLVVLGATGLGTAVKFIPRPVVVGFTNGIAVLIASTQIKDFFGLRVDGAGRILAADGGARADTPARYSPPATALGVGDARDADRVAPVRAARAGLHRRAARRHGGGRAVRAAGRNDRDAVRRHPARLAARWSSRRSAPS